MGAFCLNLRTLNFLFSIKPLKFVTFSRGEESNRVEVLVPVRAKDGGFGGISGGEFDPFVP